MRREGGIKKKKEKSVVWPAAGCAEQLTDCMSGPADKSIYANLLKLLIVLTQRFGIFARNVSS